MCKGAESISKELMQASLLFPVSFSAEAVKAVKRTELLPPLSASQQKHFSD